MMINSKWYESLEDKQVKCTLCPNFCVINEGQRGRCYSRINYKGTLQCDTANHISAVAVDPIEKKPLYHFMPATEILSIGSTGCNLSCKFCQNWHISTSTGSLTQSVNPKQLLELAISHNVPSVAFTYNEPLIGQEYLHQSLTLLKKQGIKTVLVSNGYINPEPLHELLPLIDAINFDLKAFDESFYKDLCAGSLKPVLETIKTCSRNNIWIELTQLIIPGKNDDENSLLEMLDWITENIGDEVPLHLTAFHPAFKMKDVPVTPEETLHKLHGIASQYLKYVYLGNIAANKEQSTLCPSCKSVLISRTWHHITVRPEFKGQCPRCSANIPGVWK
jgi:pyruvate formate lyase activating enzyme